MWEIVQIILSDVIGAVYQSLLFSVFCAFFCMYYFIFAEKERQVCGVGYRQAFLVWIEEFRYNNIFRKRFWLVLVVILILFRTLFNRKLWNNPVQNVIGPWRCFTKDDTGWQFITAEPIENFALFFPLAILILWNFDILMKGNVLHRMFATTRSLVICSCTIECIQLFMRLGTFQLSDLFFNVFGGVAGVFFYYCCVYFKRLRRKSEKTHE